MDPAEYDKLKAEWIMEMLDAMPRLHQRPTQCPRMGRRGAKGPLAYVLLYGDLCSWPWLCEIDARATIWRATSIMDDEEQHALIPEIDHLPRIDDDSGIRPLAHYYVGTPQLSDQPEWQERLEDEDEYKTIQQGEMLTAPRQRNGRHALLAQYAILARQAGT